MLPFRRALRLLLTPSSTVALDDILATFSNGTEIRYENYYQFEKSKLTDQSGIINGELMGGMKTSKRDQMKTFVHRIIGTHNTKVSIYM